MDDSDCDFSKADTRAKKNSAISQAAMKITILLSLKIKAFITEIM